MKKNKKKKNIHRIVYVKKFPRGKFQIIVIDPPWDYMDQGKAGKRGASQQYETLTLPELIMLPIERLATPNCVLFIWYTDTHKIEAHAMAKAYGFNPKKDAFVWVKITKDGKDFRKMLGRHTRTNAEYVLIATKGKMLKRYNKGISQIIATVPQGHSKKPEELLIRIEMLYESKTNKRKKIELFRRGKRSQVRKGWRVWGKEVYG